MWFKKNNNIKILLQELFTDEFAYFITQIMQ